MSEPCWRCGARADVECGHRPVDPEWQPIKQGKARKPRGLGLGSGGGQYNTDRHRRISKGPSK